MKKTFRSRVDLLLLLPILLILFAAGGYMVYYRIIIGIIAAAVLAAFVCYLFMTTRYELTNDHKLKIKNGFFSRQEIYIKSIKRVGAVRTHKASSALSPGKLEINYNRYGRVVVAPNHRSEFIRELKEVNPRIRIEERN